MSGLIFAVVAAVAGAALGGGVLAPRLGGGDAAPAASGEPRHEEPSGGHKSDGGHGSGSERPVGSLIELTNVIVNPSGSQGSRFLMATVVIEVDPRDAGEALREREIQVRDAIISVLESKTLRQLTMAGARDSLKGELAIVAAQFLPPDAHASVYLPRFVIQ